MANLTEHFSKEELGVSGVLDRVTLNAFSIARDILEPIRAHYGTPVRVHSGYRDYAHNARVGGKPTSWHLFEGAECAVDFDIPGVETQSVFDWMRLQSKLPFDKVILEKNASGKPACIHVQYNRLLPNRRFAYTGSTGAAMDYQRAEVTA